VPTKEKNPKHRSAYKKENLNQNYKRIKNEVKFKIEATTKIKLKVKFESTYQKKSDVRIEQHHKRKIQSRSSKRSNLQEKKTQVRNQNELTFKKKKKFKSEVG